MPAPTGFLVIAAFSPPPDDGGAVDGQLITLTETGLPTATGKTRMEAAAILIDPQAPRIPSLRDLGVTVSVIVPTLNEAENLPYVFSRLPEGLHEVIVVDGHSTDATTEVARQLRPDVRILEQAGRGKGDALRTGFEASTGEIIAMIDADGSTDAAELPRFIAALVNGADFVKGSRFAQGGYSADITVTRRIGNRGLNALVNTLYGTSYTDLCYGYNAFWARCLPYMRVDCDGFEVETLINVRIAKAGLVIHEVPSFERERLNGESNLRAIRDGLRVLRTIGIERLSQSNRLRLTGAVRRAGAAQ